MGLTSSSELTKEQWFTINRKQLLFSYEPAYYWIENDTYIKKDGELKIFVDGKEFAKKKVYYLDKTFSIFSENDKLNMKVPIYSGKYPLTAEEFRTFCPKISSTDYEVVPHLEPGLLGMQEEFRVFYIFYDEFGNKYSIINGMESSTSS